MLKRRGLNIVDPTKREINDGEGLKKLEKIFAKDAEVT